MVHIFILTPIAKSNPAIFLAPKGIENWQVPLADKSLKNFIIFSAKAITWGKKMIFERNNEMT